jgi:phosphoserine phosphatase RsbX
MSTQRLPPIECGVASWVRPGNTRSGDLEVVFLHERGALLAAVDGIGHGAEAYLAALTARAVLEAHAGEEVVDLVERCHHALRSTRGVVMSVASIDRRRAVMHWLGVGNVRAVLYRADATTAPARRELLLRSGIVGAQLPTLQSETMPLHSADTLVFATDGIHSTFADKENVSLPPNDLARHIMNRHRLGDDDALVLVARMP